MRRLIFFITGITVGILLGIALDALGFQSEYDPRCETYVEFVNNLSHPQEIWVDGDLVAYMYPKSAVFLRIRPGIHGFSSCYRGQRYCTSTVIGNIQACRVYKFSINEGRGT